MGDIRKIVILSNTGESFPIEEERLLKEEKTELVITKFGDIQSIQDLCRKAYVVAFSDAKISKEVIDSLEKCHLIIRYGIGFDNIDLEAAKRRGIAVCNAPAYGVIDVAEHTIALLLSVSRQTVAYNSRLRGDNWSVAMDNPTFRLNRKVLGLIGFGRIARNVALAAKALGMEVVTYDPYLDPSFIGQFGVEVLSLEELYHRSHCISLHLPLSDATRNIIDRRALKEMQEGVVIINTSRGGLINLDHLVESLEEGQVGGAGLDVLPSEPLPMDHPIYQYKNVVLTPHIAWYSQESIVALHHEVCDDIVRVLRGEEPINRIA
ncbi:MAG: C-terminal binding protein [Sphaerochaetaceae bacterium]|jgi:D-3-phosphoglycerate dehydrogenase|nr:C-terminal binding protein [Sphaerochaetaceae bacterium]HHU89168.1 C-terminal binding protein [Spirochaetales bacterium]